MNLKELLLKETTKTRTENEALAFSTTLSPILDLFGIGGAGRTIDETVLYQKISQALAEDLELALRCVLFLGDIRQGQGERRLFKTALQVIIDTQDERIVKRILDYVPHFARWDYLFSTNIITHKIYSVYVLDMIKQEISKEKSSLIFKWLPSVHTHGKKSLIAKIIMEHLEIDEKTYRKLLSTKRKELKVVEKDMSANKWSNIDYSGVPSKANLIYKNAFLRHDEKRYNDFLESVKKGETKINAGVLYPHEIVHKAWRTQDNTLETLWNALPDYVKDKTKNTLPMVDVSGSMFTSISKESSIEAIHVSIGMGLYLAERLEGQFKDTFLTFSETPQLVKVSGTSLYQRIRNVENSNWGYNTNFTKAFELILNLAIKNNLKQDDLPTTIVVFSDMEFDIAKNRDETPFEEISKEYASHNYKLPQVVFWNLNARNVQFPVRQYENGTILVSGYSPTTLQYVLSGELKTPYELMIEVLNQERYNIFE